MWGGVASADDIKTLFTHTFSDSSELALYSSNQSLSATLSISSSGSLVASFSDGDNANWNSNHGVQTEITSYVSANSGSTFGASADFKVDNYYSGVFTLAFVTVDSSGIETTNTLASNTGTAGEFTTFSGSAALTYTDGYKYYLRMTQATGYHTYDNISLYLGGVPTPDTNTLVNSSTIFNETLGLWSSYNTEDTGVTLTYNEYSSQSIKMVTTTTDWSYTKGVKADITDYVQGYSGQTFYLSVDATNWAWGSETYVNKVTAFFEVTDANGTTTTTNIVSGPSAYSDVSNNTATITGNVALEFKATDNIYLCFTHGASTQKYSNLTLTATIPETTEDPYKFTNDSSFEVVGGDTQTGTLTFETTVEKATNEAVDAQNVTSYGYAAINFDRITSDDATSGVYNGENGTGITNIVVKSDATVTGDDGDAFKYGDSYRWQVTGIPTDAARVAFWVVPYLKTSENSYWGDAFTYKNSTSNALTWE